MKERIDELLVKNGFYDNLEQARRGVMAGIVIANDTRVEKAGDKIDENAVIRIKGENIPYVSRGGLKLEKAIKEFTLDMSGKIVIDVGASTGGFTDCALQNGAKFVYAVDVGRNQLDWKLRTDNRVKSLEETHIKALSETDINNEKADYIVIDVSFISLTSVLPDIKKHLSEDGKIVALIKPQFETDRDKIEKGGIVRDETVRKEAIYKVLFSAENSGIYIEKITVSPIKGTYGNTEYLALFSLKEKNKNININNEIDII